MRLPFKALRSLKLTFFLLAYFAATGIAASLVPQGHEADYYRAAMPLFAADLVTKTGFSNFYGSLLFLVPAFIFFANLSACAAFRLARELKKDGKKRRHGPDVLHFGLVLLVASIVVGQVVKESAHETSGFVRLGVGEAVQLSGGRLLVLKSLREERYADGRPKDWISEVELSREGTLLSPTREIRVNHPLRLGALSIRQSSYGVERVLKLRSPSGEARSLAGGESLDVDSERIRLMAVDLTTGTAIAREEPKAESDASKLGRMIRLEIGSKIGAFTVEGMEELALSGLMASYDPAFPAIIASCVIAALGMFLTLAQKLKGGLSE
jgi:cytochrome c biogenesis protein ResB